MLCSGLQSSQLRANMKVRLCTGPLVLALLLVHSTSTVTVTRIFCRAPAVSAGDPANLTCHYPEDLSQSRKGIVVLRRDSIPGSRDEFLLGCLWVGKNLLCDVHDEYRIITQQPSYDVTFRIPSHQPGIFQCDYVPPEEAVTIQSCSFALKGSPPSTVTPSRSDSPTQSTERSQGRNEDGGLLAVPAIAVITVIITTVVVTLLIQWFCWRSSSGKSSGAARFVTKVTERIKFRASPSAPQHGTVESQPQVVDEEAQSCLTHNCSTTDDDRGTDGPEPYNESADDAHGTDLPEPYNEAADDVLRVVLF